MVKRKTIKKLRSSSVPTIRLFVFATKIKRRRNRFENQERKIQHANPRRREKFSTDKKRFNPRN